MKLSRLWRPHDRRFWLLIVLNLQSAALTWAMRAYPLTATANTVAGLMALANAVLGILVAIDLLRDYRDDEALRNRE